MAFLDKSNARDRAAARGFSDSPSWLGRKTPHIHVRRPTGLRLSAQQQQQQQQQQQHQHQHQQQQQQQQDYCRRRSWQIRPDSTPGCGALTRLRFARRTFAARAEVRTRRV